MRKTDYQRIAKIYDNNEVRQQIGKDELLEQIITEQPSAKLCVLDLGCGTGNYLKVQQEAFKHETIRWFGFDFSEDMLARAKEKAPAVTFQQGTAECLPYEDAFFDVAVCNFAFHHFPDKAGVLREIHRVLKASGWVKLRNIDPYAMQNWWLYTYFPPCYEIDQERFWSAEKLFQKLESLGFSVTCTTTKTLSRKPLEEVYQQAQPRDISQLDVLDDAKYQKGLQRIEHDLQKPMAPVVTEEALVNIVAQKQAATR